MVTWWLCPGGLECWYFCTGRRRNIQLEWVLCVEFQTAGPPMNQWASGVILILICVDIEYDSDIVLVFGVNLHSHLMVDIPSSFQTFQGLPRRLAAYDPWANLGSQWMASRFQAILVKCWGSEARLVQTWRGITAIKSFSSQNSFKPVLFQSKQFRIMIFWILQNAAQFGVFHAWLLDSLNGITRGPVKSGCYQTRIAGSRATSWDSAAAGGGDSDLMYHLSCCWWKKSGTTCVQNHGTGAEWCKISSLRPLAVRATMTFSQLAERRWRASLLGEPSLVWHICLARCIVLFSRHRYLCLSVSL